MAAHSLTFGTVISFLPFLNNGTCSATPGNVRRVNVTPTRKLKYTVFAGANALKVGVTADGSALADEASAASTAYVEVPAYGSFDLAIGPKSGLASISQFYIWSSTADAPYSVGVDTVGE